MKTTNIHTLFFSPTGTSRKVAAAVAQGLSGAGESTEKPDTGHDGATPVTAIDLTHTAGKPLTLPSDTAAIFAVPVYGGHVAPTALERLRDIRGEGTPAVVLAVYGNRAFGTAVAELAAFVAERGFVPVAAGAFVGEHSYSTPAAPIAPDRPDAQDLAAAGAFGAQVREKLAGSADSRCGDKGSASNGNRGDAGAPEAYPAPDAGKNGSEEGGERCGKDNGRPGGITPVDASKLREPRTPLLSQLRFIRFVLGYRRQQKRHPVVLLPKGDAARCTQCGRCVALCPTQAITRGDELHTDPARCIRCCACVKGCAFGARTFETPFAAALARNYARRKPPVTLL